MSKTKTLYHTDVVFSVEKYENDKLVYKNYYERDFPQLFATENLSELKKRTFEESNNYPEIIDLNFDGIHYIDKVISDSIISITYTQLNEKLKTRNEYKYVFYIIEEEE